MVNILMTVWMKVDRKPKERWLKLHYKLQTGHQLNHCDLKYLNDLISHRGAKAKFLVKGLRASLAKRCLHLLQGWSMKLTFESLVIKTWLRLEDCLTIDATRNVRLSKGSHQLQCSVTYLEKKRAKLSPKFRIFKFPMFFWSLSKRKSTQLIRIKAKQ